MITWLLLAGAILCEVAAALSLKATAIHPGWYALVGIGYLTSFGLLTLCLRRGMPIGVAYGVWGASGVALTAVMSAVLFPEAFTAVMGIGIALIIGGVLAVELGSQQAAKQDSRRAGQLRTRHMAGGARS